MLAAKEGGGVNVSSWCWGEGRGGRGGEGWLGLCWLTFLGFFTVSTGPSLTLLLCLLSVLHEFFKGVLDLVL